MDSYLPLLFIVTDVGRFNQAYVKILITTINKTITKTLGETSYSV